MWRAFSPPPPWGYSSTGGPSAGPPGLRAQIFQWCTAPALSALLMGLVINLLFQVLRRAGLEALPAALACLLFGGVLYLAALQAQGIHLRRLFRLC